MHKLFRLALGGLVVAGLAGCGDKVTIPTPPAPPAPTVHSVTVTPGSVALNVGQSVALAATVAGDPGVATTVTWSSSDATIASVDANGKVTAVAPGSAVVHATSTVNSAATGSASVTVNANTATVSSVTITPATAAMTIGQSITAVATVSGTNNPSQGVTWQSLDQTVATVDGNGKVTAVAVGSAVIKATSTADASKAGTLAVTVLHQDPVSISIQSITKGGTTLPVNLNGVAGQIDVTLNVDRGSFALDSVVVYIDGVEAASQVFPNGASRASAPAKPKGSAPSPVVLSINTARFNRTTGVPSFFNGKKVIAASAFQKNVGAGGGLASNTINIVLLNADGALVGTLTNNNATNNGITGPVTVGGTTWNSGSVTITSIIISYTQVQPATFGVGSVLCGGSGAATFAGSPTAGLTATNTWACASAEGVYNENNFFVATYPTGSVDALGNTLLPFGPVLGLGATFTSPGGAPLPGLFTNLTSNIDNLAPTVSVVDIDDDGIEIAFNTRFDQPWIKAGYVFADTSLGGRLAAVDNGSGVAAGYPQARLVTVVPGPAFTVCSSTIVHTGADLNETITSNATDGYRVCAYAQDALGNAAPVTSPVTSGDISNYFGVDKTAPSIRLAGSTAATPALVIPTTVSINANTTIFPAATYGAERFGVEAIDNAAGFNQNLSAGAPIGPDQQVIQRLTQSGYLEAAAILLNPGANAGCVVQTGGLGTVMSDHWVRSTVLLGDDCLPPFGAGFGGGYYIYNAFVIDRAGNQSATLHRNWAIDFGAPNITGLGFASALYTGGNPATFSVSANDDVEIISGSLGINFTGLGKSPNATQANSPVGILYPEGSLGGLGTAWDSVLSTPLNGAPLTVPRLLVRIDESCYAVGNPYASCASATVGDGSKPTSASDYDTNLQGGGALTDAQKGPNAVLANVADITGREGGGIAAPVLSTQFTSQAAPWSGLSYLVTWTGTNGTLIASTFVGEQGTNSSIGTNAFASASLWRLNTVTNQWTFCLNLAGPQSVDNGGLRFWRWTAPSPVPVTNTCADVRLGAAGGSYRIMGVVSGAGLFTPDF